MAGHLVDEAGRPVSFEGLAAAAGVSVPTLRHYFGGRDAVFRAALGAVREDGESWLQHMAEPGAGTAEEVLSSLVRDVITAWRRFDLGRLMSAGLALGLNHAVRGPTLLDELFEPFLGAAEARLHALTVTGRLPNTDPRALALSLLGPVLLALLHQDHLGGHARRPLDVDTFAVWHVRLVLHGVSYPAERPA